MEITFNENMTSDKGKWVYDIKIELLQVDKGDNLVNDENVTKDDDTDFFYLNFRLLPSEVLQFYLRSETFYLLQT